MSLRLAARRLALSAGSAPTRTGTPAPVLTTTLGPCVQRRHKWLDNVFKPWRSIKGRDGKSDVQGQIGSDLEDPRERQKYLQRTFSEKTQGNIFQDEIDGAGQVGGASQTAGPAAVVRTRENTALVLDPDPLSRVRWQRKKVIQLVRRGGRLTKEERVRATERQLLHKSEFLPTSVKKLVMLSRQIAGKSIDDAIVQMQWSKKKMAREMRYYLEEARDLAVAQRGMGLGKINGELFETPRKIKTVDGKWIEVVDPSQIYVAESWVGRGPWRGKEIDYKGRGRMGIIKHPATSFSVVLKEERTRIREYDEREARKSAKGPWVHLPNRRVPGQRPYYSW
ncbi:54S ribosomal protein L22 [Paramyrothecium foliicola]|nr:54S ribosomal protein L22 [Paramyrothecium foliicola]